MRVEQRKWTEAQGWVPPLSNAITRSAQVVLVFGATARLQQVALIEAIHGCYPRAYILGCSTAGEICDTSVSDDSIVATAVQLEHGQVCGAEVVADRRAGSFRTGENLGEALLRCARNDQGQIEKLAHVLVLSEGLHINGSELVRGLVSQLPEGVTVTGGLAGDGARFSETRVLTGTIAEVDTVAAVGLYGSRLRIGFGSKGGWDTFGPERIVTRSEGNVLLELDSRPALALYKQYLGEHAHGLPATGLLFPLSIRMNAEDQPVVRTILAVDEQRQSLTFAGDVPEGAYAHLTKASFDRLVDGAVGAARTSRECAGSAAPSLAILISCVGRKLVLKQRIEEEVEGVRDILGQDVTLTGFYSYGEIAPFRAGGRCELHNQIMTITTLAEA